MSKAIVKMGKIADLFMLRNQLSRFLIHLTNAFFLKLEIVNMELNVSILMD
jgi:hypothetical protein